GRAKVGVLTGEERMEGSARFAFDDGEFNVPPLDDLVVYELQVAEFYSTFDDIVAQLDYLAGLGVNVLELMPVTDFPQVFDWGYGPLHFFAPEDRWGGPNGLKRLVNACHARGMAVILDVGYQHCSADFAYVQVYRDSGERGPMGNFPPGAFGPPVPSKYPPLPHRYVPPAPP